MVGNRSGLVQSLGIELGKPQSLINASIVVIALAVAVLFPTFQTTSRVGVGLVALIYAFRNSTWNIAGGFAGMLSLAHAFAFGVGAFSIAVLTWEHQWNAWLALIGGVVISAAMGLAVSLLMSRFSVNAFFFALGTLAITAAAHGLFAGWELVGDVDGLQYKGSEQGLLHLQWYVDPVPFYYLTLALLVLLTIGIVYLTRFTHLGRSLVFIREDPQVAASMGIPVVRYQAYAMAISMGLTAIPGGILAQYIQFAGYDTVLTVEIAVAMVIGTLIGGAGTISGPIVAGVGIAAVNEALRNLDVSSASVSAYTQIVYSVLVILLVRFGNQGVVPLWNSGLDRVFRSWRRSEAGENVPTVVREQAGRTA